MVSMNDAVKVLEYAAYLLYLEITGENRTRQTRSEDYRVMVCATRRTLHRITWATNKNAGILQHGNARGQHTLNLSTCGTFISNDTPTQIQYPTRRKDLDVQ
jgi:hypothetical protein